VARPRLDPVSRRSARPLPPERPRIFLLCPEALAASAFCVEDALRARGYRVTVELGRRARRWVRNAPEGSPALRVLCVAQIDPAHAEQLRRGRDDFHIVELTTPTVVVQEIERIVGRPRSTRPLRPTRSILAHPTLMEQSLHTERRFGLSMALGALALMVVGGGLGATLAGRSPSTEAAPTAKRSSTRVIEEDTVAPRERPPEPVLSSAAPRPRHRPRAAD